MNEGIIRYINKEIAQTNELFMSEYAKDIPNTNKSRMFQNMWNCAATGVLHNESQTRANPCTHGCNQSTTTPCMCSPVNYRNEAAIRLSVSIKLVNIW